MNLPQLDAPRALGKRRRIALVVDHFLPRLGGIELHVNDLADQLRRFGYEPTVITTTPGIDRIGNVSIVRIPSALLPRFEITCDPRLWSRLRNLLTESRFDVVHCHGSVVSPLAYAAVYWCARLGIPNVFTVHSVMRRTAALFSAVTRLTGWDHKRTIWSTVSRFNAARIEAASGLPHVQVLPNGINVNSWQTLHQPQDRIRVTTVMRLNQKKRPFDILDAAEKLSRIRNDVRFSIVGDGPCRTKLERQVVSRKLEQAVEILGAKDRATIRSIFETTDVFALPTRLEAFGIAALEALSAGVPVVAMNRSGVTDLVTHGVEGFLANDSADFIAQIERLLDSHLLRREMSQAAVAKAGCFDWSRVLPRHLELYQAAIGGAELSRASVPADLAVVGQ
jgi:glycosyltransferase involved in cell wall biosynthesis